MLNLPCSGGPCEYQALEICTFSGAFLVGSSRPIGAIAFANDKNLQQAVEEQSTSIASRASLWIGVLEGSHSQSYLSEKIDTRNCFNKEGGMKDQTLQHVLEILESHKQHIDRWRIWVPY